MSNTTDHKILDKVKELETLLEETVKMKSELGNDWKTSKKFQSGEFIYLLHKLNKEELLAVSKMVLTEDSVLSRSLDMFSLEGEERETLNKIQGYSLEDWKNDLKKRWIFIDLHEKEKTYSNKIAQLTKLLSEEQVRELELQKLLND